MSTALGGSGLFLLVGCLCCAVFGGKSPRARHTSRFWGTKLLRVDRMPYAKPEHELQGEDWSDGPFKGDAQMGGREFVSAANPGAPLTFDTLLGNRPSRGWTWTAVASP